MKTTTTKLTIAAAFLALATGVAGAQSLKADIPFAFRAGGKMMPAGEYTVHTGGSAGQMVVLRNYYAKQGVVLLSNFQSDPGKAATAAAEPVITFECGIGRCSLVQIWTGTGPARSFYHASPARGDQPVLTSIRLMPAAKPR